MSRPKWDAAVNEGELIDDAARFGGGPLRPPAAGPDRARRSGSAERAILESLSNHVAARAGLAPPRIRRCGDSERNGDADPNAWTPVRPPC